MCAGASANATYGNFTSDRIISAPTDINWIVARVLVLNDSDIATANTLVEAITLGPYNTSGALHSEASWCLIRLVASLAAD